MNAYKRIGYIRAKSFWRKDLVHRIWALRKQVVDEIVALFPGPLSCIAVRDIGRSFVYREDLLLGFLFVRRQRRQSVIPRWILPYRTKQTFISLVCRCDGANAAIHDYHLIPRIEVGGRQSLRECDPILLAGKRVRSPQSIADSEGYA